jgi:hypothetical protein
LGRRGGALAHIDRAKEGLRGKGDEKRQKGEDRREVQESSFSMPCISPISLSLFSFLVDKRGQETKERLQRKRKRMSYLYGEL